MKRPRTGHVRPNLQGEAGIFQGVVPADVVDPLIGQDHVAPFGDTSLDREQHALSSTRVILKRAEYTRNDYHPAPGDS